METQNQGSNTSMWIASLAISVACCAVLFVVFAEYLTNINRTLNDENARLAQMSVHESQLLSEIQQLRHAITPNAVTASPPASTGPATMAPAAASPSAIPEVPAKP